MAQLSDLPSELKLILLQHCSFKTCSKLLLVSKAWHGHVLDNTVWEHRIKKGYYRATLQSTASLRGFLLFKRAMHYGLAALEEWELLKETEGEAAYEVLKSIHTSQARNKQQQFEQLAIKTDTYARLILFHLKWWDFIQGQERRAHFLQKIIAQWPTAIYYVLENEALRNEWLNFLIPSEHIAHAQAYKAIRNMLNVGGVPIAWLWSTEAKLCNLLTCMLDNPYLLSKCIRTIIKAGDKQTALLWSTDTKLRQLLTLIVKDYPWRLALCVREIVITGGAPIALLWSTDAELRQLLAQMAINPLARLRYIVSIIQTGNNQVAILWSTDVKLRAIIGNIENMQLRLDCLNLLVAIGGDAARKGCWVHPVLKEDLIKVDTLLASANLNQAL